MRPIFLRPLNFLLWTRKAAHRKLSGVLPDFIKSLNEGRALSAEEIGSAVQELVDEKQPPEQKADFLIALARKGETTEEIAAFAVALRSKSIQPPLDSETRSREIIDVCGTGGDKIGSFNISTTASFILAAAGLTVAKHGNRAITSRSGSADVLEQLGVPVDLTPEQAAASLRDHGFAFFFAPKFHPAFKHIAPARKLCAERGERTIFNFLGPLLNPARPSCQLIGVPRPELCEALASVLQVLGVRRGMVVCGGIRQSTGPQFIDELSTLGDTFIAEFYQERACSTCNLSLEDWPFQPASLNDLQGGDSRTNAEIVLGILSGNERGPKRDAALFNAGAGLWVGGKAKSLTEGWHMAQETVDRGKAQAKLEELRN